LNTSKNSWYKIIYVEGKWYLFLLMVLSLIISAYLGYLTPKLIENLYASYEKNTGFQVVFKSLLLLFIAETFVRIIYTVSLNTYIKHLIQKIRSESYKNWLVSYETIKSNSKLKDHYPLGEVISRIMNDTEAIIELITSGAFAIFIEFAFIISCLISLVQLNTTSGISLIIIEVLACGFLIWGSKYMGRVYLQVRKSTGIMSRVVANLSSGFKQAYYTPNDSYASKKSEASFDDFLEKTTQGQCVGCKLFFHR
jgi:ATP-binding cassette subfamily B multidrug efflux pump